MEIDTRQYWLGIWHDVITYIEDRGGTWEILSDGRLCVHDNVFESLMCEKLENDTVAINGKLRPELVGRK